VYYATFEGAPIKPTLYLDGAGATVDVLFAGESKVWQFDVEPNELTLDEVVDREASYRNNAEPKKNWDQASYISRTLERTASELQREGEET
jgi:hypothetical protein